MAYEVTATRRRPQNFENLIGQEFVAETLKNTIQTKKIAHAYLFAGPRGCGKTSTARIMAKALNCQNGPTIAPCGQCAACKEITAGTSMDVIEIDGASNTSVNDIRQIKDEVLFPPNSCRYKIYIIDEVHMLSTSAFNALLKTIEEPPPYCIFIFATTELQKVPATIKSRCQQFNFRLVPFEKVKEQLALAAQELGIQAEDEALYWIAREAGGSMRDSYTLFDQIAAFSDTKITYEKIRDKLGLVGVDRLNELFELCVKAESEKALVKLDEYIQNGVSIEQLISNCTDYLRSLLLIKNGVKKEALLGQSPDRFSSLVLQSWSSVQIERAMSLFMQLYRDIRYSLSPRYEFELCVSRLCWLKDYVSASEVKKAIEKVQPVIQGAAGARVVYSGVPADQKKNEFLNSAENQKVINPSDSGKTDIPRPAYTPRFTALETGAVEDESDPPEEEEESFMEQPVHTVSETVKASPIKKEPVPTYEEIADTMMEQKSNPSIITAVDPASVDFSDVRSISKAVIAEFASKDPILSSSLMRFENWKLEGELITATTDNRFLQMQTASKLNMVTDYLKNASGKNLSFNLIFVPKQYHNEEVKLPLEVEILKNVFRGEIV